MTIELVRQLPYDHPYRWDGTIFGGARLWRPSDLGAPLALWLDAEDSSTITLNGSTVSQWADKSGLGNNATQPVAASQPEYQGNAIAGKNAVTFVYDFLNFDGSIFVESDYHICAIAKRYSSANTYLLGGSTVDINKNLHFGWRSDTEVTIDQYGNDTSGVVPAYSASASESLLSANFSQNTGRYLRYNGLEIAVNLNLSPLLSYTGAYIGKYLSAPFNFSLGEIVVLKSSLSTPDCQKLEGYLAWKWRLESSLPAGHPYKNSPPTV